MNCNDCSKLCLCNCGMTETRTQIILFPIQKGFKGNRKDPHQETFQMSQTKAQVTEWQNSASKLCSLPSTEHLTNTKSLFKSREDFNLGSIEELKYQNKQNTIQNEESDNQTKKVASVQNGISQRSMISPGVTVRDSESEMTIRLLQRENFQLKQQLNRLRQQEIQLLNYQRLKKQKQNRELMELRMKSNEMERRSLDRKEELNELRNLLFVAKGKKIQKKLTWSRY